MPRRSLHLPRILRFGPFRSPEQPQREPSNTTGPPSSSRSSSQLGSSQQARGNPVAAAYNTSSDSAGRSTHDSQQLTAVIKSSSAQALGTCSSIAPPSINAVPPSQTTGSDPSQHQVLLDVPRLSLATISQTSLLSQQSTPSRWQDGKSGMIHVQNNIESRNVSVQGDGNNVNYTNTFVNSTDIFMEKLLEKTILGAAHDSSARDPPPRCHPGTRLAILARCLEFIANAVGEKKMHWIFGAAGVGKSAIMQNVAESPLLSEFPSASIFFSVNGRNDGVKTIITLAYQLAASCEPYRALIEYEITHKPSLLQASVSVQFKKFVIEPFIHHPQLKSLGLVSIIIDGLDECDKPHTQRELLQLISDFCSTYPSSPIVWTIASRPEPHITSFFAQNHVKAVYEKKEILVDSNEARSDVEKYLRSELAKIQKEFCLGSRWPREQDVWEISNASGGLFVFADTVIKYIGDRAYGNPTSQLNDVLKAIHAHPLPNIPKIQHPMARLDMLYAQIMSKVPERIMVNTRKILLALVLNSIRPPRFQRTNLPLLCNWLGMTPDDAYAAVRHLSSVLYAPERTKAYEAELMCFHKSFLDYTSDFARSGFSSDIEHEARELEAQCTFRVLEEALDGIDFGNREYAKHDRYLATLGVLAYGLDAGDNISLVWQVDEEFYWNSTRMKIELYKMAISNVGEGIRNGDSAFCTEFCIRTITSRFHSYLHNAFPYNELQNLVFERSRRNALIEHGILELVPVKAFRFTNIVYSTRLQFHRPFPTTTNLSQADPWNASCKHKQAEKLGKGPTNGLEHWTTEFEMLDHFEVHCHYCCRRLKQQLEERSPDHPVTVLFTSTDVSFVEFRFIDPDDGVSEWTYWLVYFILEKERRMLGSRV